MFSLFQNKNDMKNDDNIVWLLWVGGESFKASQGMERYEIEMKNFEYYVVSLMFAILSTVIEI